MSSDPEMSDEDIIRDGRPWEIPKLPPYTTKSKKVCCYKDYACDCHGYKRAGSESRDCVCLHPYRDHYEPYNPEEDK